MSQASFSQRLFSLGLQPGQPAELQARIRFTNRILLAYVLLSAPYVVLSYFQFRVLVPVPATVLVGYLACFPLQRFGYIYLSRLMLTLLCSGCLVVFNALLSQAHEPPITSLHCIQLATMLLPWLLFTSKEKGWITATLALNVLLFFSFPLLNRWLEIPLDDDLFRNGPFGTATYAVAVFLLVVFMLFLNQFHSQVTDQNIHLLQEMQEKQQAMQQAEHDMKRNIAQLEQAQQAERQRNWASEGIAQCTRLIRQHGQTAALHDHLLQFMVGYVEANQGALFVVGGTDAQPYLEQAACYAYGRKKYLNRRIELGEGLAGQAYLERETVYLTQVPEQYVRISSGLGDARPRAVLVVPLKENDRVEGILELAGFKPFEPYQIEFLEKLGEAVASSIHNARVSELTRRLLEESRQQAEQMRAQEEEMRQNLEELAATQEEMERKERAYIARLAAAEAQA